MGLVRSLAALPVAEATQICLDLVEFLNEKSPTFQHQLEQILSPPKTTTLPEIEKIWDKETARRQNQSDEIVPEVIKDRGGFNLSEALNCLRPQSKLHDAIINEYLCLIQDRTPGNVLIAPTWLLNKPRKSNFDRKDGIDLLRLVIPVHHPHSNPVKLHWTLAVLERDHRGESFRLVLYDSLCQQAPSMPQALKDWLADLELSGTSIATPNPQQSLFSQDCGLFVLLCARLAASGAPIPSQTEVRYLMRSFRRRVLAEVLAGKLDPTRSDFEEFQKNEKVRQAEARTLAEFKPHAILREGGNEVVDLTSPTTTTYGGDFAASSCVTWEPSSTINPRVLSYRAAYSPLESAVDQNKDYSKSPLDPSASDQENAPKSPLTESMFVSSPESDNDTVASLREGPIGTGRGLPTPAPSRSNSPSSDSQRTLYNSLECSTSSRVSSPKSTGSSSYISSQGSDRSAVSSNGNTTVSMGSLPKLGNTSEYSVDKSSDRCAETFRKAPCIPVVYSECSTPDGATSDRPPGSPGSTSSPEGNCKASPLRAPRMTSSLVLEDLQTLPSILESGRADRARGAITISLPKANPSSQVDIDITHPTMVQSLAFHEETIMNNSEIIPKRTRVTLQPQSLVDIDYTDVEKQVLLFEEHVQKGDLTQLCYVPDILVGSQKSRAQLVLPSSKITNAVGNALRYTSGRFDGIHTPMAYLSEGYGTCFAAHLEDYSLCSMNYLWYGAPKVWIIIPPLEKTRFETLVRDLKRTRKKCSQFVRHEGVYVPLGVMKRAGIEYHIIIQHPGELVFTFPDTYHQGFNLGPNLAEAINYAIDLGNVANDLPCSSICPGGERIPQSGMLKSEGSIIKRRVSDSPAMLFEPVKRPKMTVDVLASFAHLPIMAHTLQHAIAAKRRSNQTATASPDLLRLWHIVNTNGSLHMLESRWFRERFAREWIIQWESRPRRSAGHYMRYELGFQDFFPSAQKAAQRARIWVDLCDIFRKDLGDDCIVVMCAVAEITSTVEQLGRSETTDLLQEVANRKNRVLPQLRAIVPAFQYILGLRRTLPTLPIEDLDLSGDVMAKELANLHVTRFRGYFKM